MLVGQLAASAGRAIGSPRLAGCGAGRPSALLDARRPGRRRRGRRVQHRARATHCPGLMLHTRHGWWLEEAGERDAHPPARWRHECRRRRRRRRLSRHVDGMASPRARARARRRRARGRRVRPRPERSQRRVLRDAVGRRADASRPRRRRRRARRVPSVRGRGARDRRLVRVERRRCLVPRGTDAAGGDHGVPARVVGRHRPHRCRARGAGGGRVRLGATTCEPAARLRSSSAAPSIA